MDKLLNIEFIRYVDYPRLVANVVMDKKATKVEKLTKWCMCTIYTHVNEACLKDNFSLPRMDRLVDATAGYELLTFLDAFLWLQLDLHASSRLGQYNFHNRPRTLLLLKSDAFWAQEHGAYVFSASQPYVR